MPSQTHIEWTNPPVTVAFDRLPDDFDEGLTKDCAQNILQANRKGTLVEMVTAAEEARDKLGNGVIVRVTIGSTEISCS